MKLYTIAQITTNNFTDPKMTEKIQTVWQEVTQQLPEATTVYGVYHTFASDYRGDYMLAVATETMVTTDKIEISPSANYRIFKVDATQEMGVYQAWQQIWELEDKGQLNRAYQVDYEKYYQDGSIEIYIEVTS